MSVINLVSWTSADFTQDPLRPPWDWQHFELWTSIQSPANTSCWQLGSAETPNPAFLEDFQRAIRPALNPTERLSLPYPEILQPASLSSWELMVPASRPSLQSTRDCSSFSSGTNLSSFGTRQTRLYSAGCFPCSTSASRAPQEAYSSTSYFASTLRPLEEAPCCSAIHSPVEKRSSFFTSFSAISRTIFSNRPCLYEPSRTTDQIQSDFRPPPPWDSDYPRGLWGRHSATSLPICSLPRLFCGIQTSRTLSSTELVRRIHFQSTTNLYCDYCIFIYIIFFHSSLSIERGIDLLLT